MGHKMEIFFRLIHMLILLLVLQAVYHNYHGDFVKALDHFIECANWQKAHSIFMTSVAHSLFLSGKLLHFLMCRANC